jgi:hypothetical protein
VGKKRIGRPPLAASGEHAATERMSVSMTPELHARLMRAVVEREESASAIIRAALERELS